MTVDFIGNAMSAESVERLNLFRNLDNYKYGGIKR